MFSRLRELRKAQPRQSQAKLSILCRGKPIGRDELFAYTNGHFLIDEQRQLDRRHVKFNVDALCDVVAKIPFRIAGPISLTTAAEVGVLEYLKMNTTVPVPRVLSWSTDKTSPVGAEYIIMEKARGVPLFERWGEMPEPKKLQLIRNLSKHEAQFSAIQFPGYGGLYLRADAEKLNIAHLSLDGDNAPSRFSIGPTPDRSFYLDPTSDRIASPGDAAQGSWNTRSQLGMSIIKRELSGLSNRPSPRPPTFYIGTIDERKRLLESTIPLVEVLDSNPTLHTTAQPTFWHSDLPMGNIFVSPDEPSQTECLIDFQSLCVMPAFLQCQWPIFLRPPQEYAIGLVKPKLPDNYDELSETPKACAKMQLTQEMRAKAYEIATNLGTTSAYNPMIVPRLFRELFTRWGEVSEFGVLPLQACLIEFFQSWSALGFTNPCPLSFTDEEIAKHERQFQEYQDWHEAHRLAREALETDAEGWISPQVDIVEKRKQNRELLGMFVEQMVKEKTEEDARRMWPFPDDS
ncbi:phosphotransferase enzyme family protein [Aspergillus egyptiacus]|nr:phosphotransferase enzyme family protein [Aspergillus egyptiacus]